MKKFEILEAMNEAIAVFDYDTYDIIYMNKIVRDLMKMNMEELRKKKCYEIFGENNVPCSFCNKVLLDSGKNGFLIRKIKGTDELYFMHGCVMEMEGKKYRVEQAVHASEIDTSVGHLQGLFDMEKKFSGCIKKMISMNDYDESINYLMDEIIDFYDSDRACLSYLSGECQGTVITERCNKGITQKFYAGEKLPLSGFMQWESTYSPIRIQKVFCEGEQEQEWMREAGLENLMILSFEYNETGIGYISIDNIKKNSHDSQWIESLAFFIANELQKKTHMEDLSRLSYYDTLTPCKNRNAYNKKMKELKKKEKNAIGLIMVSMNGLKVVNTTMGYSFGDKMIQKTADLILRQYEKENVYRISGDEFMVICENIGYQEFSEKADLLLKTLMQQEKGIASVGYVWDEVGEDLTKLEQKADKLMRSEKQYYYMMNQVEMSKRPAYIRFAAEELANSKFVVYLQPKCYAKTREVYGAEALVRRIDEKGNIVYPAEFIQALEQENLISRVDFFVFEKVCETLKKWEQMNRRPYAVSCNFSRITVAENNFVERILEVLDRTGVDSAQLIFEITESSNVVPFKKMNDIMLKLKERNITFALDDMGTEYSTLQMLKLPTLTTIKFDRSLINQLEGDEREQYIVNTLIKMCHGLNMECVAEGVENERQLKMLKNMECDKIQGYLIGHPMPIEEFEKKYVLQEDA